LLHQTRDDIEVQALGRDLIAVLLDPPERLIDPRWGFGLGIEAPDSLSSIDGKAGLPQSLKGGAALVYFSNEIVRAGFTGSVRQCFHKL
jgi:hypothetical protein